MPYSDRFYYGYVDDSGSGDVGNIWTALLLPADLWGEYLGRWLGFRNGLYRDYGVPASFELHAQVWMTGKPEKHLGEDELALVKPNGVLTPILDQSRDQRRERSRIYERALKTIGGFTEAKVLTVFTPDRLGKVALYDDLLCFVEEAVEAERGHCTLMVDGAMDSGGHIRTAHRALEIKRRRVIEDGTHRRSSDSQLLQMADFCAYSAFQSVQDNENRDPRFNRNYETLLKRLIVRPFGEDAGRCIRGLDVEAGLHDCVSQRINDRAAAGS